jgi:hypothetical protein
MAKEKKPSNPATPQKAVSKKSSAKKVAVNKPVAAEVVATAAIPPSSSRSMSAAQTAQPSFARLHDEIRLRAYELYRERGGQHGSHEADWHRAESEVRSKYKF